MSKNIKDEIDAAKKEAYKFDEDEKGKVIINKRNVILAEAIYQIRFKKYHEDDLLSDRNLWPAKKCFLAMKRTNSQDTEKFKELLDRACSAINSENSTHLRGYEKDKIVETICSTYFNVISFKEGLKNTNYPIIDIIRELKGTSVETEDGLKIIRDNYSFATKLCHYACFYLFEDEEDGENNQDIYSIYDILI